jgi:hypothetical protein
MAKRRKRYHRTTQEGAEQLLRTFRRIATALDLDEERIMRSIRYGEIELADTRSDRVAFGIGATLRVKLQWREKGWARFDFDLGWSSCGGSPADAIAQATIIRNLAERAAIAQCIARESGAEWTAAEIDQALDVLREERREYERKLDEEAKTTSPQDDEEEAA